MKVADEVARWLEEKGITHAFGIIGGGNVFLWDAIERRGATRLVCAHHEQAAAMASAYFNRVVGRIGSIALVTTGAGSTNAVTGVMAAHMDGIPLLILSGNESSRSMGAPTRVWGVQGYNSARLVDGIAAKASARVMYPHAARDALEYNHCLATTSPQGPAWIDFPKDIQSAAR